MQYIPLFTDEYLFSHWADQLDEYLASHDSEVRQGLIQWAGRDKSLSESQLDGLFVEKIFHQLWQYWGTGSTGPLPGYTLLPQYPVSGAGQTGGTGRADLALAYFDHDDVPDVPQVLCEFKDIKSGLDAPQNRKDNDRSPVQQCLDYLKHTFDKTEVNSTLFPTWGIVTDMNEFRLYFRKAGISQCVRFVIEREDPGISLIDDTPAAARQRFLFCRLFARDSLLAPFGRSSLEKLLEQQWTHEKSLEKNFYREYQTYRQHVYEAILSENPNFKGTRGELVQMTQRFLDRCIFLLFCEDMGKALSFPTDLLRDILIRESQSPTYSSGFNNIWSLVKQLFQAMRDGGSFPPDHLINRFNGGLFEGLKDLEELRIPNRVFCAKGQGESEEKLAEFKNTLLYLSGTYNFGSHGSTPNRTITLYALGRIFEQSITDLEYMHAEAEGVPTIAKLSKRKRDGVYYTPEWVTGYIVREVVGARLADERERLRLVLGAEISPEELRQYRRTKKKPKTNAATQHIERLDRYGHFLDAITIVDPACGSGAFLIQALQFLHQHHRDLAAERARLTGEQLLFDQDTNIRSILGKNLYGVDINPESVEITQLALWLNTASPGKPLTTLDKHIRCGNSLVGHDFRQFYQTKHRTLFEGIDKNKQEKVNVFDWKENFPEVLGQDVPEEDRGFDCVIGNPPYVKLQHFRKVKPDESDYYIERRKPDGTPLYASTQTGNFDLYLPFIEKGVSLLDSRGRMGYIAPSLWLKNEYGLGLRREVLQGKSLDRWIDFKSFQVFEEATTYTALQFYSGSECANVRFHLAPDGDIAPINWDQPAGEIATRQLSRDDSWILLYEKERKLFEKLRRRCQTLEQVADKIIVGIQTSADLIYHLQKIGSGQYRQKGSKADGIAHSIEDAIMRPLVSGPEAKRYQVPDTDTYLLFPYDLSSDSPRLWTEQEMTNRFPNAWKYLKTYGTLLRSREKYDKRRQEREKRTGPFDDDQWYRFGRNQNIDKQEHAKLIVPRLVAKLHCINDSEGEFCLDNVDVGGVIPHDVGDLFFLTGIINSPVANFVFKCISKPFRGEYFSANKQFIAPIPVPKATAARKKQVGKLAERLQTLHTERRDNIAKLQQRIDSPQCVNDPRKAEWLWADVAPNQVKPLAPKELTARERTAWVKIKISQRLETYYEQIDAHLRPFIELQIQAEGDALSLVCGGSPLVTKYGLDPAEAKYLAALWRQILRGVNVTCKFTAEKLIAKLLKLRITQDAGLRDTIINMDAQVLSLDVDIAAAEHEINSLIYRLYNLTSDEIALLTNGI
ncbi:MAG: Eco57I restriction-modification methylase domain-containing protein [Planctomycetes bacterium]|nr:Eco57I restriction-modification methylase domain-containing protein [Planctomycetota bacterium]